MAQVTGKKIGSFVFLLLLFVPFVLASPVNRFEVEELVKRQIMDGDLAQVCAQAANSTDPAFIASALGRGCPTFSQTQPTPTPTTTTTSETTSCTTTEEATWTSEGSSESTYGPAPTNAPPREPLSLDSWSEYIYVTYGDEIGAPAGIAGSILIVLGVYFMIFGYRAFRITLGAIGFVVFATLSWIALTNSEPASGYPNMHAVYLCVCLCLGVLGAIVFMFFWVIAIYFVGGLAGFVFGIWLFSWDQNHIVTNEVARVCVLLGFFLIGLIIAFFNEVYVMTVSTSFTGAFLFIFGLDFFVRVGYINCVRSIMDGNQHHEVYYMMSWQVYTMAAAVVALTALSIAWQIKWNKGRRFGISIVKA